jgi:tRNA(Arg) A34 adenosine deaminase TadA
MINDTFEITNDDSKLEHLQHCVTLAKTALLAGDEPFGSILVSSDNEVLASARNRINKKNLLSHPEIELADWALNNLTVEQRKAATMYTSGEHCPMCAGAHGWSGIGSLVFLSSANQLESWLKEFNVPEAPITFIPVGQILKNVAIKHTGNPDLISQIKELHRHYNS